VFAPLEHNVSEAQTVLTQFPGKLLADSMATRQHFLAEAGEYAILHLATHALTSIYDGDYAYFVLASDSLTPGAANSKLYVKDLYGQSWKAQLAVLSACETGIGNYRSGEGVISLGRGFAQAGVRSTVSSLWQINDTQTARLMEQFYARLQAGESKDAALQNAKISLLARATHDHAHPFYWAGYVPYGDMQPLQVGPNIKHWWWMTGLLVLVGIGVWYGRARRR
jgi:CHAT domain-containing protein